MHASTSANPLSPEQIKRRVNDYDSQIRQGLEDGTIRAVMKRLGPSMETLFAYQKGTPEQRAAFPRRSYIYNFIRAWNTAATRQAPDFIDRQLDDMQAFDERHRPTLSPPTPLPPTAPLASNTVAPSSKRGKKEKQPESVPKPPQSKGTHPGRLARPPSPSPSPSPPPPTRTAPPPTRTAPPPTPILERKRPPGVRDKEVKVEPRKFQDIGRESEEGEEDEEDEEEEEEGVEEAPLTHKVPCDGCRRGRRDCLANPNGGACLPCKQKKYKCPYAKRAAATKRGREMAEEEDAEGSEDEVVEIAPPPKKKTKKTSEPEPDSGLKIEPSRKKVKPFPVAKMRVIGKTAATGKPAPTKKGKGRQVSEEMEEDVDDDEIVELEPRPKPKPKPATTALAKKGKGRQVSEDVDEVVEVGPRPRPRSTRVQTYSTQDVEERFARLEAQVADLTRDGKVTRGLAARMTGLEDNVHRFSGALETFLGRIRIDDGLRLVKDDHRIESVDPADISIDIEPTGSITQWDVGYESGGVTPAPDSGDMEISDDDPSGCPTPLVGTPTTPSDHVDDIRMEEEVSRVPVTPNRLTPSDPHPPFRPVASTLPPPPPPPPSRPPTINVHPATPQTSQQMVQAGGHSLVPQYKESPAEPIRLHPRARSRTPLAGPSRLEAPATRARSRSKTPH